MQSQSQFCAAAASGNQPSASSSTASGSAPASSAALMPFTSPRPATSSSPPRTPYACVWERARPPPLPPLPLPRSGSGCSCLALTAVGWPTLNFWPATAFAGMVTMVARPFGILILTFWPGFMPGGTTTSKDTIALIFGARFSLQLLRVQCAKWCKACRLPDLQI